MHSIKHNNSINEKNQREQCEYSEHHSNQQSLNCTQAYIGTGNNVNADGVLLQNPITPIEIDPIPLDKIDIGRPSFVCHVKPFKINGRLHKPGVYEHTISKHGEYDEWICSPIEILGITSTVESDNFGRLIHFVDSNGKWHDWAMPMSLLKGGHDELRGELLNRGVEMDLSKKHRLATYLMNTKPERKITCTTCTGWHGNTFVLPNQIFGSNDVVFQAEYMSEDDFKKKGSLQGWCSEIGKYCIGNIPMTIAICAALAGPIIKLVSRRQGFCLHFFGDSSAGKSTVVEVAASVWGAPELIRSWRSTTNGLESLAALRNDTCLIVDEIDQAPAKEIGNIAYMLINGQEKQRANRTGSMRKIRHWTLACLSTGERTLESIMNEAGVKANSGQLVRVLSIPSIYDYGVFSDLHGYENGKLFAEHLNKSRLEHYGHLGSAFLKKLVVDDRDFAIDFADINSRFSLLGTSNLEKRAASSLALVGFAGELAIEYGLLPWPTGSAIDASQNAFIKWKETQGKDLTEDQRILNSILAFTLEYGNSRFSNLLDGDQISIRKRAGWYKDDNSKHKRIFLFSSKSLVEAGGGYPLKRISKALKAAGWLFETDGDGHLSKRTRIPNTELNLSLYYVCPGDQPD